MASHVHSEGGDYLYFVCFSSLISVKWGSWTPSQQYLEEAVDFSFADFETLNEIEEEKLETVLNPEDVTAEDVAHRADVMAEIAEIERERAKEDAPSAVLRRRSLLQKIGQTPPDIHTPFGPGAAGNGDGGGGNMAFNPGAFRLPFDPRAALPNPANIINADNAGDEGEGDEEMQALRTAAASPKPKGKGRPGFLPGVMEEDMFSEYAQNRKCRDAMMS